MSIEARPVERIETPSIFEAIVGLIVAILLAGDLTCGNPAI